MSWQAYVDNLLASHKVDQAAIFSRAGDSVWAQSPGFEVSAEELQAIARGFDDPEALQASGLRVQGQKYFYLKSDDHIINCKQGDSGVIAVRTKQTIVLAHYSPPTLTGEAVTVVEAMADHLIKSNF